MTLGNLNNRNSCHNLHTEKVFLQCGYAGVPLADVIDGNVGHNLYTGKVFLQCGYAGVALGEMSDGNVCHNLCIGMVFLQCASSDADVVIFYLIMSCHIPCSGAVCS